MSNSARFARETEMRAAAVVVARQPILDHVERIVGFELLTPPEAHPHEATASVLSQAIADIGLHKLVGDRPAHVDVTREFLLLVNPLPLDPDRVVLELPADERADAELLGVLREAREAGFKIALDGYRAATATEALLELAESVKIDVAGGSEEQIGADVDAARGRGLQVIANGVPDRQVYGFCRGLGFDAFQGQYFAEPVVVQGASVPTTACARSRCWPPARPRPSSSSSA
jgi:c-di-GMP phosphodiesterase